MAYVIFDLDGTVIDSSHRHATLPDGSLDLAHWVENATPEKIAQDDLLPLAASMRRLHAAGHKIIICTARCLQDADFQFFAENDLPFHVVLSRQGRFVNPKAKEFAKSYHGFIGDSRGDADMKAALLTDYFASQGLKLGVDVEPIMFDDNLKVVSRMIKIGVHALDATKINRRIIQLAA